VNVLNQQVPARRVGCARPVEALRAMHETHVTCVVLARHSLDNRIDACIRSKAQRIEIQGSLIVRARQRELTQVLEAGGQLKMRVGMTRIKGDCLLP